MNKEPKSNESSKEMLIVNSNDVTKKAHENVPLQRNLRVVWFCFCVFVTCIWTKVNLDSDVSEKKCFVMENQNGTFEMVENVDEGLIKSGVVTNVGTRFE